MIENFLHQAVKVDAELFHSNMLAFLWQRYPALANKYLSDGFLQETELVSAVDVHRELFNIDVLLMSATKVLGIENKLKSRHTSEQINSYLMRLGKAYKSKKPKMIALCLTEHDRVQTRRRLNSLSSTSFISYREHVLPFLRDAVKDAKQKGDNVSTFYLNDYIAVLEQLLNVVTRHEDGTGTLSETIQQINADAELIQFRMVPLVQRRIFERIHSDLISGLAGSGECDEFLIDDVCIGSRSKQGQITTRLKASIPMAKFDLYAGLQLEGAQLRRFVRFEKRDGTSISAKEKIAIHVGADKLERRWRFFSGKSEGLLPTTQSRHFKETACLMPFLAYKNAESEFFVYRAVIFEEASQSIAQVGTRLVKELMCIKELVAKVEFQSELGVNS